MELVIEGTVKLLSVGFQYYPIVGGELFKP